MQSPPDEPDELRTIAATVFVSDPSAEAERVAQVLRTGNYLVVDVPLSMLVARVAVQRPRVVLVDADAEGALDTVARMRELPECEGVEVLFLGRVPGEGGAAGAEEASVDFAWANEGSAFFSRPVDIDALVKKIDALTGAPGAAAPVRPSAPPPSVTASRPSQSLPPPSMRALEPGVEPRGAARTPPSRPSSIPRPPSRPPGLATSKVPTGASLGPSGLELPKRPLIPGQSPLSQELEQLLADAEQRVGSQSGGDSGYPSPDEEIAAVLPAEVLATLDSPLDDEDDDDGAAEAALGAHAKGTTNGGGRQQTTGSAGGGTFSTGGGVTGGGSGRSDSGRPTRTDPPLAPKTHGGTQAGPTGARSLSSDPGALDVGAPVQPSVSASQPPPASESPPTRAEPSPGADTARPTVPPPTPLASPRGLGVWGEVLGIDPLSKLPPHSAGAGAAMAAGLGLGVARNVPMPSVLAPGDAARALAQAITSRAAGALCFESQEGVRRAVLREGDLVTAASGVDSETLLAFLTGRGDLPRDQGERLAGKVPPFGRHAGAALVAHGHLRQDQLWPVLRAHAEWILGRAIQIPTGTAVLEHEPPGRLRGEPSVFGGSTGAEIFVEVVRRVIAPEEAMERCGGAGARIDDGANADILPECALAPREMDLLLRARGGTLGDLLGASAEPHITSVVYALTLLGVFQVIRAVGERPSGPAVEGASIDTLDEDALRARVRARLELVEEADYFALLGVSRDATGYEVRRAFLELRRAFEPSRILTPEVADLSGDVRKIAAVLDEAYEILRDNARRERYRRAIEWPQA
jgi:hypothetical protein